MEGSVTSRVLLRQNSFLPTELDTGMLALSSFVLVRSKRQLSNESLWQLVVMWHDSCSCSCVAMTLMLLIGSTDVDNSR